MQRIGHRLFVDQCAAGGVDENEARIGLGQQGGVDKGAIGGRERAVKTDHIAGGKGLLQTDGADVGRQLVSVLTGDGEELQTEGAHHVGHGAAYVAKAHNGHALAHQLHAGREGVAEVGAVAPHALAVALHVGAHGIGHLKQERRHELGYSAAAVAGAVAHGHAVVGSGLHIHAVVTCGGHAHQAQGRQGLKVLALQARFVDNENFGLAGTLQHFLGCGAVVHGEVAQRFERLPSEVAGVDGISVKKYDVIHGV